MTRLGIIALINFNDWSRPEFKETGGINSVVKSIMPYLIADRIVLYGFTFNREKLLFEN